jgi:hypothetical protein
MVLVSMVRAPVTRRVRPREGAVGDALQEAGVVFEGADVGPVHLVGVGVEVVVAERLQAGEHLVDLGFLADEGVQSAASLLRRAFSARSSWRGVVIGFRRLVIVVAPGELHRPCGIDVRSVRTAYQRDKRMNLNDNRSRRCRA